MTRVVLLFVLLTALPASADEIAISRFGSDGLKGWESKNFKGTTDYTVSTGRGASRPESLRQGSCLWSDKKNYIQTC
jgi:hypothetical protein